MNLLTPFQDVIQYFIDARMVKRLYKERFGRSLNWDHPTHYTEKIQKFKISPQIEKLWKYVDKYEVRSYITQTIGEQYLTTLYGVYNSPDEIDFNALPKSFALKATHGSGWNILVPDKSKLDIAETKQKLSEWLHYNYYRDFGRERQYKNIPPRIICEEYLETKGKDLYDYKFFCFHGEPTSVNVIRDRSGKTAKAHFDLPWKPSELQPHEAKAILKMDRPPKDLDQMLSIAKTLAQPFSHVRVDLYNIQGRILFGELTFTSSGGMTQFTPDRFDELFGSRWKTF